MKKATLKEAFITVIKFILRKKTLVSILFILFAFLVKELTALSIGEDLSGFCDTMLAKYDGGYKYYFFSTIKAFFTSGSKDIVFITIVLIANIALLKFIEIQSSKIGIAHYIVFVIFLSVSCILIYYLLFEKKAPEPIERYILIEPTNLNGEGTHVDDYTLRKYRSYYNNLNENSSNPFYLKVTDLYEQNKSSQLREQISSTFQKELSSLDEDETLGYVVAAYFGQKNYSRAAEIVLERNKLKKSWDHSLKLDLSKCIRFYSLQNGFSYGLKLVDTLEKKYNANILSKYWTVIPFEIMEDIEHGFHLSYELDQITLNNLNTLLQDSTNNDYCDYAHYLLDDYQNSLTCFENSRIKDIVLYAISKDYIDSLSLDIYQNNLKKRGEKFVWYRWANFNDISVTPVKTQELEKNLEILLRIKNEYPNAFHCEDAIFYASWLYCQKHDYKKALETLNAINLSKSYSKSRIFSAKQKLYELDGDIDILSDFQATYKSLNRDPIHKTEYIDNVFNDLSEQEKHLIITQGKISYSYISSLLDRTYKTKPADEFVTLYDIVDNSKLSKRSRNRFHETFKFQYEFLKQNFAELDFADFIRSVNKVKTYSSYLYRKSLKIRLADNSHVNEREIILYKLLREDVNHSPENCKGYLDSLKIVNPQSDFLDDMYAEVVFAEYIHLENPEVGEKYLSEMLEHFESTPNNALDNALYWVTMYYLKKGYFSWKNDPKARNKAKYYKNLFLKLYPKSFQEFEKEDVEKAFQYVY